MSREVRQNTYTVSAEYLVNACCSMLLKQCILRVYLSFKKGMHELKSFILLS